MVNDLISLQYKIMEVKTYFSTSFNKSFYLCMPLFFSPYFLDDGSIDNLPRKGYGEYKKFLFDQPFKFIVLFDWESIGRED